MRKKLLPVVMIVCLILGLLTSQVGAEGNLSPETIEKVEEFVPSLDSQQLPLPDQATSVTSATYMITLGTIDGYVFSSGSAVVERQKSGENSPTHSQHYYIYGGVLDLSTEMIDPTAKYTISLKAYYWNHSTGQKIVFIDQLIISGAQLATKQSWPIPSDAVQVTPEFSAFADYQDVDMTVFVNNQWNSIQSISPSTPLILLVRPVKIDFSVSAQKGAVGYFIHKSVNVQSNSTISINNEDINQAVELTLPAGIDSSSVSTSYLPFFSGNNDVAKYRLSKSNYSIGVDIKQTIDMATNSYRTFSWYTNDTNVSAPLSLTLPDSTPEISMSHFYDFYSHVRSSVIVTNGDFHLYNVSELNNGEHNSLITSKFVIKDAQGTIIKEGESEPYNWAFGNVETGYSMKSGTYTLEATVTYPGLVTPLVVSREFIYRKMDGPNLNGLEILAQDESGQPLKDAQVFLYEKHDPEFYEANMGVTDFYTIQKYVADAVEEGKLFIPSANLIAGREYEVVVTGRSSNGQSGGVFYHQSITSGLTSLKFEGSNLKKLTYTALPSQDGDLLILAIKEKEGHYLSWPIAVPFSNQHQAVAYVQTDENVLAHTHLYPSDSDSGYYLENEYAMTPITDITIDLSADLVKITPPAGYDNFEIKINDGDTPRPSWYVTRGIHSWLDYSFAKDGYRYSLEGLLQANQNKQLSFDNHFIGKSNYHFSSGQVNQKVFDFFFDEQGNRLYDVYRETQKLFNDSDIQSNEPTFTVHESDGVKEMSVENTGDAIVYREISPPTPGSGGGGTTLPPLEYQLYDKQNQPVGNRWFTDFSNQSSWNVPELPGDYVLKLEKQNFPENVVKLSSDINIHVSLNGVQDSLKIPIALPEGYTLASSNGGASEIRSKGLFGTEYLDTTIDSDGKLVIYNKNNINANKEYVILLAIPLKEIGTNYYTGTTYNLEHRLRGSQLSELNQVSIPGNLIKVRPEFLLPASGLGNMINAQLFFPLEGYDAPFRGIGFGGVFYGNRAYLDEILITPRAFAIGLSSTDGSATGNSILKRINVNPTSHAVTYMDTTMYKVQFKNKLPFSNFIVDYGSNLNVYGGYVLPNRNLLNTLYVSEGVQKISFSTIEIPEKETPWIFEWETRNTLDIRTDAEINFNGEVDANASTLDMEQKTENGKTVLFIRPNLVSGDLRLTQVNESVNGNSQSPLPGKIIIKNNANQTVYAGQGSYWNEGITVEKQLPDGAYTLNFSLPIGPNKEVKLTKTFYVPGGEDTIPPTAPTGLQATSITNNAVTLSWNASTDFFGVTGYRIYSGGVQVGSTAGATSLTLTGLVANTSYAFSVKAFDAKGNLSPASKSVSVKTLPPAPAGGGGGGGGMSDPNTVILRKNDIPAAVEGNVSVNVTGKQIVILPSGIAGILGSNSLSLNFGKTSVSIPSQVLSQLSQLVEPNLLSDAEVSLSVVELKADTVPAVSLANASVESASPVFEIQLIIKTRDGSIKKLEQFNTPVTLNFTLDADADRRLTGIYFIGEDGKLTYVGGKIKDNVLCGDTSHFSKYGVFEITKHFADVGEKHWALSVIQELAAKHIVNGVSDTEFAPEKNVTRAEFGAMIVKALDLKAKATATFNDVPTDAWYADAVAAAYENGVIKGISEGRFAPLQQITREEMAVMVINAFKTVKPSDSSQTASDFKDAEQISKWAQDSVNEAAHIGLLKGRKGNLFSPKTKATRAEAVQVISNLLNKV